MKTTTTLSLTLAATLFAGAALAAPVCTKEPQSKWMSEADMKARIAKDGYKVNVFKNTGSCYEIYGLDKDGKKVEIYFNPVDGAIFKQRIG